MCCTKNGRKKLKEGRRKMEGNLRRWWWRWYTCAVGMRVLSRLKEWEKIYARQKIIKAVVVEREASFILSEGWIYQKRERERARKMCTGSKNSSNITKNIYFLPFFLLTLHTDNAEHWCQWNEPLTFVSIAKIKLLSQCNFYVINEFNNLMIFILNK